MTGMFRSRTRQPDARLGAVAGTTASARTNQTQTALSRRPRHSGLFQAVQRVDAEIDAAARRQLADWITEQYREEHGDIPLGFLARCHLGPPYVDHRLDLIQSIVEHFTPADTLPQHFAQARVMARLPSYEFIEVYASGTLVPVRVDGTVDLPIGAPSA